MNKTMTFIAALFLSQLPVLAQSQVVLPIDLGLPSGTLWADRNVGAASDIEQGDFYAWGETSTKKYFELDTYFDSQCQAYYLGGPTELSESDHAAVADFGCNWRTHTKEQFQELCDCCAWSMENKEGVHGFRVSGSNGNSIFLPVPSTYTDDRNPMLAGEFVYYWTRIMSEEDDSQAYRFTYTTTQWSDFDGTSGYTVNPYLESAYRYSPNVIRPVCASDGGGVAETSCLILWQKDGAKVAFALFDKPKVTFEDADVSVAASSISARYRFGSIKKMTYDIAEVSGLAPSALFDDKPFAYDGESITILAADSDASVKVVDVNGMIIKETTVRKGESIAMSISSLRCGAYLVVVNGVSYKIMKQ